MKRLAGWFRRSRPQGGPAGPTPTPTPAPAPGTTGWHIQQAHQAVTQARLEHGRYTAGRHEDLSEDAISYAHEAIAHLTAFAAGAEEEVAPVDVQGFLDDLLGGA
ncbi:hypothetical protein [Nocardiopsis lucentensis]|uniref:hypothetical protein n=1 Tax=Nocardiopsis lucentensis TaxID=53441 RepID=UPI00034BC381|nr:hypothetical protein [Nocardiopsis lucentensis]